MSETTLAGTGTFRSRLKKILGVMIPILITQLCITGMSLFDTVMSGHAGTVQLAGVAIDRFGKNVTFAPFGDDHFTVNVEVIVSPQFMAWLVGLGGKVQILSPDDVRERFKNHLRGCLEIYE